MPDFVLNNEGNLIGFLPRTDAAMNFAQMELGLEGWQWFGGYFYIDHLIAGQLVQSLEDEGFVVQ